MSDDLALLEGQTRILERIATGAPLADALAELIAFVEAREPGARCTLTRISPASRLWLGFGPALPRAYHDALEGLSILPPYLGACGEVAHRAEPISVPDIASERRYPSEWRDLLLAHGSRSLVSAPVRGADGRVLATLAVHYPEPRDPVGPSPHLIEVAVHLAGIALQRQDDVAAREAAVAELQAQKAQLEAVIETAPAAIWFTHDPSGRRVIGNRQAAELLGLSEADNHSLAADPEERPTSFVLVRDGAEVAVDDLPMQRAAAGEDVPTEEGELVFSDGRSRTILTRAKPMRDAAGALIGAVCTALDITDRKRAEAALRRSEEEFRALGEQQPNLCWIADGAGWIYWYNRRWYEYTGTTLPEMAGWGWRSVHDPDMLPEVEARWSKAIAAGVAFEMTFPLRGADGRFRPFLTRVAPVRDVAGVVIRWFGSNVDVSAQQATEAALRSSEESLRRLNEQLEARVAAEVAAREDAQRLLAQAQRMEALGQLAGGIAHDFNNVLQAVSGGLSLIGRRASDADAVRKLAGMAAEAAERGAAITGRLLTFARQGELRTESVAPTALLEGLREMLVATLGAAVTVRVEVAADAPAFLADQAQLETVLVNLAVNARDAMASGGALTLAADAETVDAAQGHAAGLTAGRYARLAMTDSGCGMDAATLKRASEPFFTTKPVGQGTGLGLAMARGFAEQSGGALAIHSAPGEGTTVTLWFPHAEPSPARVDRPSDVAVAAPSARALVVDDDPMVREVIAQQLAALGYRTIQASDGLDALAQLDSGERAELLVTDLTMPGMNGLLLIQEARSRLPRLPAILLTGYSDVQVKLDQGEAVDLLTAFVRKPVSEAVLARHAAALLAQAALQT